jgi:hypothetical protein
MTVSVNSLTEDCNTASLRGQLRSNRVLWWANVLAEVQRAGPEVASGGRRDEVVGPGAVGGVTRSDGVCVHSVVSGVVCCLRGPLFW